MAEYIEREALEVSLNHRLSFLIAESGEYDHYTSGFDEAVTRVEDFPAADVATVRHGRWVPCNNGGYYCSYCDHRVAFLVHNRYCPNCGAKMDGGND